ncbi:MAG: hypothetical protein Q9170_005870 [Blastenia crenularia]
MNAASPSFAESAFARVRPAPVTCGSPTILPPDVPIEEELVPDYNPKDFFPVNPGDLFHGKYETITKLGWGSCSTVWLARDVRRWRWQRNRYLVLKVNNCDFADKEGAEHELNISRHLAKTNPSHRGFPHIRTVIDNFEAEGPNSIHVCLVYEPMREPLWLFQQRCRNRKFSLALLKGYLELLLKGLDYVHSECHIVHTDLKLDNIMVGFEDSSVIEDFVRAQAAHFIPRKITDGRSIYQSHHNVGPLKSFYILPKIADFGLAQRGDSPQPKIHPIQPDHYRAPEVILGTGWTYSADIWNLGVMVRFHFYHMFDNFLTRFATQIWNLMENKDLFRNIHSSRGEYSGQAHLAEMMALLGPPPKELLRREREGRNWKWRPAIENSSGKLCERASEFYGGPFFDAQGEFLHRELIPTNVNLADSVTSLEGEDKKLFLKFVSKMLQWLPEDRKTARELLEDTWLLRDSSSKE